MADLFTFAGPVAGGRVSLVGLVEFVLRIPSDMGSALMLSELKGYCFTGVIM